MKRTLAWSDASAQGVPHDAVCGLASVGSYNHLSVLMPKFLSGDVALGYSLRLLVVGAMPYAAIAHPYPIPVPIRVILDRPGGWFNNFGLG